MKHHDVITLLDFSRRKVSTKIGTFIDTQKEGCYKLILDYRPTEPDAPMLIIVGDGQKPNDESIFIMDWAFDGNIKTHSIYGYTSYRDNTGGEMKTQKQRIGSIFQTKSHHVYAIKINLWPMSSETDILCFEIDPKEAFGDN